VLEAVPSFSTYAIFIGTCLVLLVIPGPAVLYVVSRSIDQGRRAGLASVLGITTGTVTHVTLATVGLSSLILASRVAFDAVRYAGAAYLIYLGVRRLLSRKVDEDVQGRPPRTARDLYTQGLVVNLLNPKTIVFIFAFIPQFVDVGAGHVWLQVMLLGLTFATLGMLSDSTYAFVAGTVADRLRGTPLVARVERWFGGTVLIGLGITSALVAPHRSN
jgi:threonine/homoserine/homoserine lactone efflux protein